MNFNKHYDLEGKHAFLSASQHAWVNYDEGKLIRVYSNLLAAARGTKLHEFACEAIKLGVRLPDNKQTINMYVNDAIGYKMTPELVLKYSNNAFGTADALSFKKDLLRIHDLKTGRSKVSMVQLEIYAALFCLEYDVKPNDIQMELRIYQSNEVLVHDPDPDDIFHIEDKIILFDQRIEELKQEEE